MRPSLRFRLIPVTLPAIALCLGVPGTARPQAPDRDARIPKHGSLWVETFPSWEIWDEQFALGSPDVSDGAREPLSADYDGSITSRLFPGMDPLLADLNRDALALGYDSLAAQDVSLGRLEYGTITRDLRRVPFGISFGLFDRLAVDLLLPLERGTAETSFSFDSTTAGFVPASAVIPAPAAFFAPYSAAQASLAALIEGGTLSPEEEAAAIALLERSEEFGQALESRVDGAQLLPTASSAAGEQLTATYDDMTAGYTAFGFSLPGLTLPDSARRADLEGILAAEPIGLDSLQTTVRGWAPGELEVGLRLLLLDTFERAGEVNVDSFRATREPDLRGDGVRFRTTIGGRFRIPLSEPDRDPYLVPSSPLQQPIGDGQTDVEIGVWQDVQIDAWLWLVASARYTLQLEDELVMRVTGAGAPFGYAAQERQVTRDLGDVFELRLSPRFRLSETIALGLEYQWFDKGEDAYAGEGLPDPSPLALESSRSRHQLGIGAWYRTTPRYAAGLARLPVELALTWQTSIAGSGGQTPASGVMTFSMRVPIQLF